MFEVETVEAWPHRISWARLFERVFEIDMQHGPNCGGGDLQRRTRQFQGIQASAGRQPLSESSFREPV